MPSIRRAAKSLYDITKSRKINWYPGHMQAGMLAMIGKLNTVDCVIEVHDARIPFIGRNKEFRQHLGTIKPHLLVLNKLDLANISCWDSLKQKLRSRGDENVIFTTLSGNQFSFHERGYDRILEQAIKLINKSDRYNRVMMPEYKIMVVGIPNVGKSTLINRLRQHHLGLKGEATKTGKQAGVTLHVENMVKICARPRVYSVDTPGVLQPSILKDDDKVMKLALCSSINDKNINPIDLCQFLLDYLNKTNNDFYINQMNLTKPYKDIYELCKVYLEVNSKKSTTGPVDYDTICWNMIKLFREGQFGKVQFL